ncbi:MAG: NAD(P)/FAD-dependent oxidoreductase [Candidatus Methanomethylophilaceae archaeon]|nr:NAD(P)/FAD-dependent oxidoreductase [Candidatus Methanomethylophilaceae archaeon]
MDRTDVDVLVVGSGPAGSVAARYAAESGASVMMIERRPEVGVPVRCGEFMPSNEEIGLMFPGVQDLGSLFDIPESQICLHTDGIKLVDPKERVTVLDLKGYTVDRDRFDQYLADAAVSAGAALVRKCSFYGIENGEARTNQGNIRYKVLVGADGPGSKVAQSLGLPRNHNPYPAVTSQVKGDFDPYLVMFFGDIAPGAYSWIIPKDGRANVGVGFSPKRTKNATVGEYMDRFVEKHGFEECSRLKGKYVPSEGPIARTVAGNGLVVGDAAGQVISVNGGGIPLAMIAGRMAGRTAAEASAGKCGLDRYEGEWRAVMEKPLKTAAFNKKLADTFAFRSETSTTLCMRLLGQRRLGNLIRCKRIFP